MRLTNPPSHPKTSYGTRARSSKRRRLSTRPSLWLEVPFEGRWTPWRGGRMRYWKPQRSSMWLNTSLGVHSVGLLGRGCRLSTATAQTPGAPRARPRSIVSRMLARACGLGRTWSEARPRDRVEAGSRGGWTGSRQPCPRSARAVDQGIQQITS